MLDPACPYQLQDTGQGFQRVQAAPRVAKVRCVVSCSVAVRCSLLWRPVFFILLGVLFFAPYVADFVPPPPRRCVTCCFECRASWARGWEAQWCIWYVGGFHCVPSHLNARTRAIRTSPTHCSFWTSTHRSAPLLYLVLLSSYDASCAGSGGTNLVTHCPLSGPLARAVSERADCFLHQGADC
jgi:hypothetical protein